MKRKPVKSSHILSIGYDESTRTLEVEFLEGNVWQYTPITKDGYLSLINDDSVGSYFHKNIKTNNTIEAKQVE